MSDLFFVFGIGLTVMALVVAFLGMRSENFPSARAPYVGILAVVALFVVGSAAFAVVLSREEQKERRVEVAEFRAEEAELAEAGEEGAEEQEGVESEVPIEPTEGDALMITSPEGGDLIFDTEMLEAAAGTVTIAYTNPSPVPHNVAIEDGDEVVGQSETVTEGDSAETTADLEPGDYVFFCSIPGHRESGMEGVLTID